MSESFPIYDEHFIGAVKLHGEWRFFHHLLIAWILNYRDYDDTYIPTESDWRYELMKVDEKNAEAYVLFMAKNELPIAQIPFVRLGDFPMQAPLTFVVNFDERLFVNGWHDNIPIHEYIPQGWRGIEDNPYDHIPSDLSLLWNKT
ncbi:MAG: hypothetical protein JNJ61_03215 [Anaerolineae bacterium]|nr:hypothetical protein [Anaerolineae bacterium]